MKAGGPITTRITRAPRRGDVYWVALDPTVGTEIKKTRPAVGIVGGP